MKTKTKRAILATAFLLFFACNFSVADTKPNLGIDYQPGINYVTHLYTLGEIGYQDAEYSNKYGEYLSAEDKSTLNKHKNLLVFGQGKVGKLTTYFFFMPAYANLKTYDEYKSYFEKINKAIDNNSLKEIEKYVPEDKKEFLNEGLLKALASVRKEFNEIAGVYIGNIKTYMNEVYPTILEDLKEQKVFLNELIGNKDVINKWQNMTNYKWDKGDYIYLLFRAGKRGPSFNNLSENINSCYYNIDEKYIVDMFSHEFGIFLMYDEIIPLTKKYKKKYPDYKNEFTLSRPYWMAYEMLAVFFNIKINNKKTMDYYVFKEADPIAFMEIYTNLYEEGITDPEELYKRGIDEYMDAYWNKGVEERYESLQ